MHGSGSEFFKVELQSAFGSVIVFGKPHPELWNIQNLKLLNSKLSNIFCNSPVTVFFGQKIGAVYRQCKSGAPAPTKDRSGSATLTICLLSFGSTTKESDVPCQFSVARIDFFVRIFESLFLSILI